MNATGSTESTPPFQFTRLCLKNAEVLSVNMERMSKIPGRLFYFIAIDGFSVPKRNGNTERFLRRLDEVAEAVLTLKEGRIAIVTRKQGEILPGTRTGCNVAKLWKLDFMRTLEWSICC